MPALGNNQHPMGFREIDQGIPSSSREAWKKREAQEWLRQQLASRWKESERLQGILRSAGAITMAPEALEIWADKVRPHLKQQADEAAPQWTPNSWFHSKFPDVAERFGNAFFEETSTAGPQHRAKILPCVINEDFFAGMLGGEKTLGHRIIHLPGEGFLYLDLKVNAFANTSDQKVEILLSNYLIKCAENMGHNVESKLLVKDHRRPSLLAGIVSRAKTVLEADPRFFQGVNGARRHAHGTIIQPATISAPEDFIHHAFTRSEGGSVIVGEAYQEFLRYCQMGNLTRVEFTEFKRVAKQIVLEKFPLGLRHDIRTPEGRQTHGWKHIRLLQEPNLQANEAA